MVFRLFLSATLMTLLSMPGASAADYLGNGAALPDAATLHIGPGYSYDVLATIRPGTAPRTRFCEYHGRWCYGAYGRWNGWFYGEPNTRDHWGWGYWAGH